jgi:DNA repair exonuclease SbcCD ATPase subunit
MRERGVLAEIKIVEDSGARPVQIGMAKRGQQAGRKRPGRDKEKESKDSGVKFTAEAQHLRGQKSFRPEDTSDSEAGTEAERPPEKEPDSPKVGEGTDTEDSGSSVSGKPDEGGLAGDRDPWVVDINQRYKECERQRRELQVRLAQLQAEHDILSSEASGLRTHADDLIAEIERANRTGRQPSLANVPSPQVSSIPSHADIPQTYRANLTTRATQARFRPTFEMSGTSEIFSQRKVRPPLSIAVDLGAIIAPSPEQVQVFQARQNVLRMELDKVQRDLSQAELANGDLKRQLDQREQLVAKLQDTIGDLEAQLAAQRANYQESLNTLRDESLRYADSRVKEAMDVRSVTDRFDRSPAGQLEELSSVSQRIAQLNKEKERLEEQLREERANVSIGQRQVANYAQRVQTLEAERDRLIEEVQKRDDKGQMQEWNGEVHLKLKRLERKYAVLKEQNEQIRRARPNRDFEGPSEHAIDASESEDGRDPRRVRTDDVRLMTMRTQNEEMQAKLARAQGTIDRLNQLLQRKEAQIGKLKEQMVETKQQLDVALKPPRPGRSQK